MPIALMDNFVIQDLERACLDRIVLAMKIAPMMNGAIKAFVSPFHAVMTQTVMEGAHASPRDVYRLSFVMTMLTAHSLN